MFLRYKATNMKILQILWKKGNNSKTGIQNYFKISGQVDLVMLIIFIPNQIFYICNGFWVIWQILQFYSYVLL